jgi:hypothetical protein
MKPRPSVPRWWLRGAVAGLRQCALCRKRFGLRANAEKQIQAVLGQSPGVDFHLEGIACSVTIKNGGTQK